jgi:hypothetical protein
MLLPSNVVASGGISPLDGAGDSVPINAHRKQDENYEEFNSKIVFSVKYPPPQPITQLNLDLYEKSNEEDESDESDGESNTHQVKNGAFSSNRGCIIDYRASPLNSFFVPQRTPSPPSLTFDLNKRISPSSFSIISSFIFPMSPFSCCKPDQNFSLLLTSTSPNETSSFPLYSSMNSVAHLIFSAVGYNQLRQWCILI